MSWAYILTVLSFFSLPLFAQDSSLEMSVRSSPFFHVEIYFDNELIETFQPSEKVTNSIHEYSTSHIKKEFKVCFLPKVSDTGEKPNAMNLAVVNLKHNDKIIFRKVAPYGDRFTLGQVNCELQQFAFEPIEEPQEVVEEQKPEEPQEVVEQQEPVEELPAVVEPEVEAVEMTVDEQEKELLEKQKQDDAQAAEYEAMKKQFQDQQVDISEYELKEGELAFYEPPIEVHPEVFFPVPFREEAEKKQQHVSEDPKAIDEIVQTGGVEAADPKHGTYNVEDEEQLRRLKEKVAVDTQKLVKKFEEITREPSSDQTKNSNLQDKIYKIQKQMEHKSAEENLVAGTIKDQVPPANLQDAQKLFAAVGILGKIQQQAMSGIQNAGNNLYEIIVFLLFVVTMYMIANKAGYSGWKMFIPIYNVFLLLKIAGKPWWHVFLLGIPLINMFAWWMLCSGTAERFGKSGFLFKLGMFIGPMWVWLALGNHTYRTGKMKIRDPDEADLRIRTQVA